MPTSKGRIVVLDDSRAILEGIAKHLASAGFEALPTSDVRAAARLVPTADVAIVDFHMGDTNGFEAVKILRKAAEASHSPCRFYLYTTDQDYARKAVQNGFDGSFAVKENMEGLVRQLEPAVRASQIRAKMMAKGALKS